MKYNWLGETAPSNSSGEQSYQLSEVNNNNWTATFTANYRLGRKHQFMVNDVFTRILWFLGALLGASLPLTGYYIWIRHLRRKK